MNDQYLVSSIANY